MNKRFELASFHGLRAGPHDVRHIIIEDAGNRHPSMANGLQQVARQLLLEQLRAGDSGKIFYLATNEHSSPPADVPLEIIPLRRPRFLRHQLSLSHDAFERMVRGAGPRTIFHIHGFRQPLLIALTRRLRRRRITYAITGHSRYAHIFDRGGRVTRPRTVAYAYVFERPILHAAGFVHLLTDLESPPVRRIAPRSNIQILPNGSFSSAREGIPPKIRDARPSPNYPVFGFFGRLAVQHKGLDLLVQGFARYRRSGGKGLLEIMGTGDQAREELVALCAELEISKHVRLLDPLFDHAKDEVLRRWDFFVLPSRFDRMPLASLEAALLGLPLLMSVDAGLDVESHGAGLLIRKLDSATVAGVLKEAEEMPPEQWSAMSENAHTLAISTADWTSITRRLRALYLNSLVKPLAQGGTRTGPATRRSAAETTLKLGASG